MGVRLAALAFERGEALVISATLDAAGIPNWIYWYNSLWNTPARLLIYDGFQIVVTEESFEEAQAVLKEALENPCVGAETLTSRGDFLDRVFGFFLGFVLAGGAPFKLRQREWR
ncbi:MAG: hypothetical protein HY054_11110 [Proteobacteria bacterium]|nr:hypothetical protein [Pseudomonadota bacterium]